MSLDEQYNYIMRRWYDKNIRVCPVKSSDTLPKDKLFASMEEINKISVDLPIKLHQIVIKNILNTGIDIITTKEIK